MMSAQSNATLPGGNIDSSAKKLEWTRSTASGSTFHSSVCSVTPSRRLPAAVAE